MAIDPNIIAGIRPAQFDSPANALAQMLKVQAMQQDTQMGAAKLDEYRVKKERANKLTGLLGTLGADASDDSRISALKGGGFFDEADKMQAGMLNRQKTEADVKKSQWETQAKKLEIAGQAFGHVRQNPSLENANATLDYLEQNGVYDAATVAQYKQAIAADPSKIAGLADQAFRTVLGAKEQLMKVETRDTGSAQQTIGTDPLTGKTQVLNSVAKSATPGELIATRDRKLAREQSDRHHSESQSASLSKPMEVTGPDGTPILIRQDRKGNISEVPGYSPKRAPNKPLPQAVVKQLQEARENASTMARLNGSFKDDYASKGVLGYGGEAQLAISGNLGGDQKSVAWWKDYRKQAELVERHAMFGAALTPGEQASWRSADIGPGMDRKTIKANLQARAALTKKILATTTDDMVDAGHNSDRVRAIGGREAPDAGKSNIDALLDKYGD